MKLHSAILSALFMVGAFASSASASVITQFDDTLTLSNSTQLGRLSRSGTPSTWDAPKTYPGVVNAATTYYYKTYSFASSLFTGGQYVQLDYFDYDTATPEFYLSAYANSYDPLNKATNFLGDAGSSPNFFGGHTTIDPVTFQIVLPSNTNLILVLNETIGSGAHALNKSFNIEVENFSTNGFDDPIVASTPEPSSLMLLGTGLAGMVGAIRRRVRA